MDSINFKINRKIEVISQNHESGISLIQDIQDDNILIAMPMKGNRKILLDQGDEIDCIYSDDNNAFMFTSKVLGSFIENIGLYKISFPTSIEKVQRRDFVRVPKSLPFQYIENNNQIERLLQEKKLNKIKNTFNNQWKNGIIMDLSGGGIKASLSEPLQRDDEIVILIEDENLNIGLRGRVVRCSPFVLKDQIIYHIGMKFIDISERERDKIISVIFRKLRELRKLDIE